MKCIHGLCRGPLYRFSLLYCSDHYAEKHRYPIVLKY